MEASIFLGKLFGYVLVLMALHVFFCKKHFRAYAEHMLENPGVANFMSFFAVIMGVLLLLYHNVWAADWGIVVTLLCWVVLIRGLFGFFCPEGMAKMARKMLESSSGLYIAAVINAVIGVFLLVMAYMY